MLLAWEEPRSKLDAQRALVIFWVNMMRSPCCDEYSDRSLQFILIPNGSMCITNRVFISSVTHRVYKVIGYDNVTNFIYIAISIGARVRGIHKASDGAWI
jgi:hypothetical protein